MLHVTQEFVSIETLNSNRSLVILMEFLERIERLFGFGVNYIWSRLVRKEIQKLRQDKQLINDMLYKED